MHGEGERDHELFLRLLWQMEAELIAAGMPPIPKWWRTQIERFERSGKRRMIVRKGRRVFASTCVAPRLAVAEMLFGEHDHVLGTPPLTFAFLSVRRDEASKRLIGVRAILDVLGERYTERGDTIELANRPAVFAVVTANHRSDVGSTNAFNWLDELARWNDDSSGANPAEEVVGSLAPALATLPNARMWLVSSPLSTVDFHARAFDEGETAAQCVAFGSTWEINPTLTEEATHKLEPDLRIWQREYLGIPPNAITAAFDADTVTASFGPWPDGYRATGGTLALDMASGGDDPIAFAGFWWLYGTLVSEFLTTRIYGGSGEYITEYKRDHLGEPIPNPDYEKDRRPPRLRVAAIGQIKNARSRGFTGADVIKYLAQKVCAPAGISTIVGDQHLAFMLEPEFRRYGIYYRTFPWTGPAKVAAVERIRQWLADGTLSITSEEPESAELRRQLLQYDERILKSGQVSYSGRGTTHDDLAAVVVTAALADAEGALSHNPYARRVRRAIPPGLIA